MKQINIYFLLLILIGISTVIQSSDYNNNYDDDDDNFLHNEIDQFLNKLASHKNEDDKNYTESLIRMLLSHASMLNINSKDNIMDNIPLSKLIENKSQYANQVYDYIDHMTHDKITELEEFIKMGQGKMSAEEATNKKVIYT